MISFVIIPWILATLNAPAWIWIVWAFGLVIKVVYTLDNKEV